MQFHYLLELKQVVFEIGNCLQHCEGCHSPELWTAEGAQWLTVDDLKDYIKTQRGITAVVFMGGTTNYEIDPEEFLREIVKPISKEYPVGLYHGCIEFPYSRDDLTWLKIGRYIECQGGLASPTTNQKMFYKLPNGEWINITSFFTKENNG